MNWALFLIGPYSEIQKIVVAEVDSVSLEDPSEGLSFENLKKLEYVECCLKETLRTYPSVPFISRSLESDISISNDTILIYRFKQSDYPIECCSTSN